MATVTSSSHDIETPSKAASEPPFASNTSAGAARAYRTGKDPAERSISELATQMLPIVQQVVLRFKSYLPPSIEVADLNSVGLEAMMETLRRHAGKPVDDLGRLVRQRARGAILDELRKRDWASRGIRLKTRHVETEIAKLEQSLGRAPTDEETRKALGLTGREYSKLMEEIRPVMLIPIDAPYEDEQASTNKAGSLHDRIADPSAAAPQDGLERRESVDLMVRAIHNLPEVPRKVIAMYYYEEMRLAEIAAVFGLTESRICQIHTQAVVTLRSILRKADAPA